MIFISGSTMKAMSLNLRGIPLRRRGSLKKTAPAILRGLPGLNQPERGANSTLPVAARTFRYCLLHDLGEPGSRGYSLWLVVHWLKSRLPEVTVIQRRYQESVEMVFPRFYDRGKKFNWRPVAPTVFSLNPEK